MSYLFQECGNPELQLLKTIMHDFGSNLFLRHAKSEGDTYRSLDEYGDKINEVLHFIPGVKLDPSALAFYKNGPKFVEDYICLDTKFLSSIDWLQHFFEHQCTYLNIYKALFGEREPSHKNKFLNELFDFGFEDLSERNSDGQQLVNRVIQRLERAIDFSKSLDEERKKNPFYSFRNSLVG